MPYAVHVAMPCHESWAAMTPAAAGRHCAACAKTVVDFTQKTDAEILVHLARAAGAPCGRFRADQLARPLVLPAAPSRWRTRLATLLTVGSLGTLLAPKAAAQYGYSGSAGPIPIAGTMPGEPAASRPASVLPIAPPASLRSGLTELRGTVRDARTHEPLPGVTVLYQGTSQGASTNSNGEFALLIEAGPTAVQLSFQFVGYLSAEQTVAIDRGAPVTLVPQADLKEEMMGMIMQSPWPWHPRRLYYWSKYQLARAFGR